VAKTKRTKRNKSPGKPYRNAKAYIAAPGDRVAVAGVRGRTTVKRITNEAGSRRVAPGPFGRPSIRITEAVPQVAATGVGDRKPKGIFVGREYTGVQRSKTYPYRSKKRGAPEVPLAVGLMARAAKAVKRVVVKEAAE
jgi:hypothetical protein